MAETPISASPPPPPPQPQEPLQYWCYHCEKRVTVETVTDLPDIICFECKNGFVELISIEQQQQRSSSTTTTTNRNNDFSNQFLQILRLIAEAARDDDNPPPPPPPPPVSTDHPHPESGDFLRIELNGWNNVEDEDQDDEDQEEDDDEDGIHFGNINSDDIGVGVGVVRAENEIANEEEEEDDDDEREEEDEQKEQVEAEAEEEDVEENENDDEEEEEDSNGSRSSKDEDNDEYVTVNLADIRKEVQCPICLGIIRKTRTVMECLHRFCRECIDKSMRMGNNECPACRTHCASRRSLRDDPNYDALIAALYQDIDKYEAEELAFREEEKTRNKQIQASIAQTFQRQTEALGRKRTTAKAVAAFMRRSRGRYRRGRSSRNSRATELQVSDDDEDENGNEGGRDSSSADERVTDVKSKRCKRWSGPRYSQPSPVDADGGCDGNNDLEVSRESTIASPAFMGSPEVLAWGRGGARSHTRYGSISGNGKNGRNNRIARLVDHLRSSEDNIDKLDVHLVVVPLDDQIIPSLEEPFLRCRPTLCVGQLCQFVSLQTPLQAEDVEILLVKEPRFNRIASDGSRPSIDPGKDILQLVEEQETLGELLATCNFNGSNLVLAYREKVST